MLPCRGRIPAVTAVFGSRTAEGLNRLRGAVAEVLGGRDDRIEAGLLQKAAKSSPAIRISHILELPHLFAYGVEASEKLLLGPCEDQTPVLDAGDADDTARFEG